LIQFEAGLCDPQIRILHLSAVVLHLIVAPYILQGFFAIFRLQVQRTAFRLRL